MRDADPLSDGTYYIGMILDTNDTVEESNEDNNSNQGEGLDLAPIVVNNTCPDGCEPDFSVVAPYTSPTRTTCGAGDDCNVCEDNSEHIYQVTIPSSGMWEFDVCDVDIVDYDTLLYVTGPNFGECDDNGCIGLLSKVTGSISAGTYSVHVGGWQTNCGNYVLRIQPVCFCGDGVCGGGNCSSENACNCPQDCDANCGDGCCTGGENSTNCCHLLRDTPMVSRFPEIDSRSRSGMLSPFSSRM